MQSPITIFNLLLQFLMDLALLNILITSRLISLGMNGQMRKKGVLNMIVQQRTTTRKLPII